MKTRIGFALLLAAVATFGSSKLARAQACHDEEDMFKSAAKNMSDLVDAVKKEAQPDFERAFHQKTFLSRSSFALSMTQDLIDCLKKAGQDANATPDQLAAYKAKVDQYTKLKSSLDQGRSAVKSTDDPKAAKSLIEKLTLGS
jgi:hypothetical protein